MTTSFDEEAAQIEQMAVEAPTPQVAEPAAAAETPAKPKRGRAKKAEAVAA